MGGQDIFRISRPHPWASLYMNIVPVLIQRCAQKFLAGAHFVKILTKLSGALYNGRYITRRFYFL